MKKVARQYALGLCVVGLTGAAFAASSIANELMPAHQVRALADDNPRKEDKGDKIAPDKLPKKVVDSVKKDMPGARITKAYKKTEKDKTVYYLDDVKVGKKGWDLTVGADGKILKKEECHDDD